MLRHQDVQWPDWIPQTNTCTRANEIRRTQEARRKAVKGVSNRILMIAAFKWFDFEGSKSCEHNQSIDSHDFSSFLVENTKHVNSF